VKAAISERRYRQAWRRRNNGNQCVINENDGGVWRNQSIISQRNGNNGVMAWRNGVK
jgi:hypothetical protein